MGRLIQIFKYKSIQGREKEIKKGIKGEKEKEIQIPKFGRDLSLSFDLSFSLDLSLSIDLSFSLDLSLSIDLSFSLALARLKPD